MYLKILILGRISELNELSKRKESVGLAADIENDEILALEKALNNLTSSSRIIESRPQAKAKRMDRELDIVHECLTELYNVDLVHPHIIKCLDKIKDELGHEDDSL